MNGSIKFFRAARPALVLFVLVFVFPAAAIDRTMSVDVNQPLEVSLPPSDALTEWVVQTYPEQLAEFVSVRRLPAESLFLFRPLASGTGIIRFSKKLLASSGAMSENVGYEVEVMFTQARAPAPPATAAPRVSPPGMVSGETPSTRADTTMANFWSDPLIMAMIEGELGFPAKNPEPPSLSDTEEAERRRNPLPFSLMYVIPPGSYLLNPTHRLPLPDTPPGVDTAPPAYHQAVALAKRGLFKQAVDVIDELIAEMKKNKVRNVLVETFYEFVNAHIEMASKNYKEAANRFKTLYPSRDFGFASRFYGALALEYSGDTLGAVSGYQGVISYNPEGFFTPEAAYRIARVFSNAGAFDRAAQEYWDYTQKYPQTAFIDDTVMDLARIYDQIYSHQDFDVALKLYNSMIQDYSESPYLDTALTRKKFILENYF